LASAAQPHWSIESLAAPTDFSIADNPSPCERSAGLSANNCDIYYVNATDVASTAMEAKEVKLEDTLPAGLTVRRVALYWSGIEAVAGHFEQETLNEKVNLCTIEANNVKCVLKANYFSLHTGGHTIQPDDTLKMEVAVTVNEPATPGFLGNHVKVEGGGAPSAQATALNTLEEGQPPFGPTIFSAPTLAPEGTSDIQAGSHPYELPTHLGFASSIKEEVNGATIATSVEDPRDVLVDLPPGLAGSALSTPKLCTFAQLTSTGKEGETGTSGCPMESILGNIRSYPISTASVRTPLFNMLPEHGAAAEFGFIDALSGAHVLYASLVPSPQGYVLRTSSKEIPQVQLDQIVANVYGDPAARQGGNREAKAGDVPTLTAPAYCSGEPLLTQIHTDSWRHPGGFEADGEPKLKEAGWVTKTYETEPVTGCNKLAGLFKPTLEAHPTTTQADSPSGIEVTIRLPQKEDSTTLATPPLKRAVVTLPEGMSVNPASANGLEGCSLAQIGVSPSGQPNAEPVRCPDASKLGKVELKTPALPGTLEGAIYVAKQKENPFNSLLSLYITVEDPKTGVVVKIPAEVRADPQTGRLITIVDNSPQFPFEELTTRFFGGQKAALRTPAVCGTYEVTSTLTPWSAPQSGPPTTPAGSFEISGGCAQSAASEPHSPSFEAGTVNPLAGAFSPFALRLRREDASQELKGLDVTLPPGLVARLAGVGECPEPQIAAAISREREGGGREEITSPSCPASSEVGTATVGAGAGLTPYYTTGHAYLAGPYEGAPLSLAVITPAVAGPYDLGAVVVRAPLRVNTETAQVTAASSLPHILDGIPLDVRSIALQMGRSQFTLNPTDCEKMAVTGAATSVLGQIANLTNPFQVGGCSSLGFAPKLALSLEGKTNRGGFPALKAVLTMPPGGANIASAQVTLPHAEFIANAHIGAPCTRVQYAAGSCPAASVIGTARAETPLLDQPLEGPVYLMSGFGHLLPDVAADLNGQIHVFVHGKVDKGKGGGLRNTFEVVPDAPVSKFTIELLGAGRGLLENSEDICAKPQHALAQFTAQSGKVSVFKPLIANSCKKKSHKHKHRKHKRHRSG
jgi:hypothetical protein